VINTSFFMMQHIWEAPQYHFQYFMGNGCQLQHRYENQCCQPFESLCKLHVPL
jgi:hypothetical protein